MKYLMIGAALLAGMAVTWMGLADDVKTRILCTGLIGGTLAMFLVAMLGRVMERRDLDKLDRQFSGKRYLLGLLALSAHTARALFMFVLGAAAIGALVGLACYAAIKIWSAMLTIEHKIDERNEVAAVTVSEPFPVMAARPVADGEVMALESSEAFESVLISTRPWLWLTRPVGAAAEWSTNLTDWIEWDGEPKNVDQAFWRVAK